MGTLTNSEDPHDNVAVNQDLHCYGQKDLQIKNTSFFFFLNYNWTPLDMYNGLSQIYFINPDGRIH